MRNVTTQTNIFQTMKTTMNSLTFPEFCATLTDIGWWGNIRDPEWWEEYVKVRKEVEKAKHAEYFDRFGSITGRDFDLEQAELQRERETWIKQRHKERYDDVL